MLLSKVSSALGFAALATATLQIIPGGTWTATNTGKHIQAHGAGVIEVDGTYYLIGEDKTDGSAFQNVNCYSSKDLVQWGYVGALLTRQSSGDLGPNRVVERPKVIYNSSTKQYVLYMHIDDSSYGEAKVGVATGSSPCGTYSYRGSFQPLGQQSRDTNLFQDDDGTAYLLTEDRANGLRIDKLSPDYLTVSGATYLWPDAIEAPAMIKKNGVYFIFGSHLTGWDANDNVYSTSTSISGPWSSWKTFAPSGTNTFDSQTNYILPVGSNVMYMGDRWHSDNLMASTYIWLPLTLSGTTASMPTSYVNWLPSTFAGGPSENSYEGESATLGGGAKSVACSGCSGGKAAGYVGGTGGTDGAVTFSGVQSNVAARTTVRIKFENGNTGQRFASVRINGVAQTVAFLPTDGGNTPESSSLNVDLKQGANEIVVQGTGADWGPDVDRLMVPVS
ncbi:MAG: hypothetical protein MMC23_005289 [Stictis urceolatum]|nr:hypothetical protein [Stictis urceolata]